jgi:hypothetical protein
MERRFSMKHLPYILTGIVLCFQGIYSQGNDPLPPNITTDTSTGIPRILGELWLTGTLGGRVSGTYTTGEEAFTAMTIGADFFILGGFSIGPEFGFFANGDPLPLLALNLGYTYWLNDRRGIYLRAGYGKVMDIGTYSRTNSRYLFTSGLGMKFPVGLKSVFRVELDYRHQRQKNEPYVTWIDFVGPIAPGAYDEYRIRGSIGILIGLSVAVR